MTTTVAPLATSRSNTPSSTRTSSGWRPMVGSSNTNTASDWALPISLASFNRWASPPESAGVGSPSVKYPRPKSCKVVRRAWTFLRSPVTDSAWSTLIAISCGRLNERCDSPLTARRIAPASGAYRDPPQSGHSMVTSGRNCTSSEIEPVPSHVGQRSRPVLYEKSPAFQPPALAPSVRAKARRNSS